MQINFSKKDYRFLPIFLFACILPYSFCFPVFSTGFENVCGKYLTDVLIVFSTTNLINLIKSNEHSEDSHIVLADFFFRKKSENARITTDVHSYILMHL